MADGPIEVVAVGSNGIAELSRAIPNDTVSWALQRIIVGSDTLARPKYVSITCSGSETPIVMRGRLLARSTEAENLLGFANVTIDIQKAEECTTDMVLKEVLSNVVADHGAYTVEQLQEEYQKTLKASKMRRRLKRLRAKTAAFLAFKIAPKTSDEQLEVSPEAAEAPEASDSAASGAAADAAGNEERERGDPTTVPIEKVLQAVADSGEFNWAILEPVKLRLHNGGCGGFEEMKDWFEPNKVMFGIIRISVGSGIAKQVFIHWIGPEASTVKKGQWNSKVGAAQERIREFMSINLNMTANGREDLNFETMMKELGDKIYGVEDLDASKRGVAALRDFHKEQIAEVHVKQVIDDIKKAESVKTLVPEDDAPPEVVPEGEVDLEAELDKEEEEVYVPPLAEALEDVRNQDGQWNWVLVKVM